MTNILVNNYVLDAHWCLDHLKSYIKADAKVVILPFSFRDEEIRSAVESDRYYAKEGKYYNAIITPLLTYGVKEENIFVANYFQTKKEELCQLIEEADILYFTGGLPDKTMERCKELGIVDALQQFDKTVIGVSAGAMIQMDKFHISPDEDYKEYQYCNGIGWIKEFDLEVHYSYAYGQKMSIRRALLEEKKNIYAITEQGGLIVENGEIKTMGSVELFYAD